MLDRILAHSSHGVVDDTPTSLDLPLSDSHSKAEPGVGVPRRDHTRQANLPARHTPRPDARSTLLLRQCLKLAMAVFSGSRAQVRSLGFTSAIGGEGKTFVACATATALAQKANRPVVLVDCNWDHPTLHTLYDLPDSPGLAEWVRGECDLSEIRRQVAPHLIVIPAGMVFGDAINVTGKLASHGISSLLTGANEVMIVDMPPVLTSSYAAQLAQELDAVTLVVRARATWDTFVAEAQHELENAQVEGIILNATHSRIPRWLQRIL